MSDENLLIKIGADTAEALQKLNELGEKPEHLSKEFDSLTKIAAVSFAAFTAEIALSVVKFEEADAMSRKLSQALQNQGIFSAELKDKYVEMAEALSATTGIETSAIEAAQATIQTYLGEKAVTADLTQGIADLATAKGITLTEAAKELGKALEGNAGRLRQEGLIVDENMSRDERYAQVIDFVSGKFGGQAEAANQGLGSIKGLEVAFNQLQEEIGEHFAPVITAIIQGMTHLFQTIKENPVFTDLAAAVLAAGAAIAGVIAFFGVLGPAIAAVTAAAGALGISLSAALFGIPLIIGAVVAAVVFLATNWEEVSARIVAIVTGLNTFLAESFGGIGKILASVFKFDIDGIKAGLEDVKNAFKHGYDEAAKEIKSGEEKDEEVQIASRKQTADRLHLAKALEDREKAEQQAKFNADMDALEIKHDKGTELLRTQAEVKKMNTLRASIKTERDAVFDEEQRKLKAKIDADNQQIAEEQRFGAVYAAINHAMHQEEFQGAAAAVGPLVALQNSKSAELKAIGKAAAIADITIKTAQSAMAVFAGFQAIPFGIGIALGLIGAGAVIAYGAEQIGDVVAAADGGLMTGGIPGVDSIPVMAQHGELIVPEKNFEEVVGAVQSERSGGGAGNQEMLEHLSMISKKLDTPPSTNINVKGDFIGEDQHVDRFIKKINQAVLYRNAQVLTRPGGVTGNG